MTGKAVHLEAVGNIRTEFGDVVARTLPPYESTRGGICKRKRKIESPYGYVPDSKDMVLTEDLKTTSNGEQFLLFDSHRGESIHVRKNLTMFCRSITFDNFWYTANGSSLVSERFCGICRRHF